MANEKVAAERCGACTHLRPRRLGHAVCQLYPYEYDIDVGWQCDKFERDQLRVKCSCGCGDIAVHKIGALPVCYEHACELAQSTAGPTDRSASYYPQGYDKEYWAKCIRALGDVISVEI